MNTSSFARDTCARFHKARTTAVLSPLRSGSVANATINPWRASGVTRVVMARCRLSYVQRWGKQRKALLPASKRQDNTGLVAWEPQMAMSTLSWR